MEREEIFRSKMQATLGIQVHDVAGDGHFIFVPFRLLGPAQLLMTWRCLLFFILGIRSYIMT
jgi:hypothetical protein